MRRTKILLSVIGVGLVFGLLWHSRVQADAIDHYQPAILNKAADALDMGQPELAIDLLQARVSALRHNSVRAAAQGILCRAHYQIGDYEKAEQACDSAVARGRLSASWNYLNNRGVMRLLQGKLEAALADFSAAAGLNPRARSVQKNLRLAERELSARQ